ncbi:MAG TPA: lysophospholipid acyltransferase family protein [Phycisphaerales bacterium]|nr:lysophospholipid acyltransferase family protein [Phycisphaerales bacterium]
MFLKDRQPGSPLHKVLFYEFVLRTVRLAFKILFRAKGYDSLNVPATGPVLLASNHESFLDPPTIAVLLYHRHLEFIARASLFKGFFGHVIKNLNAIPLKDESGDAGAIKEALRRLEVGRAVLIFPEGSRTPDGHMHEFKRGVALLVKKGKCPVVPVAIAGAYERWPIHRKKPTLTGPRVRVLYGQPIPYDDLMKNGADAALERVRAEVVKLRDQLKSQTH